MVPQLPFSSLLHLEQLGGPEARSWQDPSQRQTGKGKLVGLDGRESRRVKQNRERYTSHILFTLPLPFFVPVILQFRKGCARIEMSGTQNF